MRQRWVLYLIPLHLSINGETGSTVSYPHSVQSLLSWRWVHHTHPYRTTSSWVSKKDINPSYPITALYISLPLLLFQLTKTAAVYECWCGVVFISMQYAREKLHLNAIGFDRLPVYRGRKFERPRISFLIGSEQLKRWPSWGCHRCLPSCLPARDGV